MYVDYEYRVTVICVYHYFPRFLQRLPDLIEEEIPDIKNKVTIEPTSMEGALKPELLRWVYGNKPMSVVLSLLSEFKVS